MYIEMPFAPVRLLGVGTAVPEHRLAQSEIRIAAERILAPRFPEFERLAPSFEAAGVRTRYSVVPLSWFEEPKDWEERTRAYRAGAKALFIAAADAALKSSGLAPEAIDTVVTVSSTGIATPTLEAMATGEMGFRPDVRRVPLFGLGCAGGVSGLSVAARLAGAMPGSKVLLVCVETCTLAFRTDRIGKADIIATVLFGDGAAAACASTDGEGPACLGPGAEHTWPDTLGIMGWDVAPDGLGVVFDRSIPEFVRRHLAEAVVSGARQMRIEPSRVSRMVCHPGGVKVIEAIERALQLPQGQLDHEREVLGSFGNMSSPTVLFVLERLAATQPRGDMVLAALGPGFTASMLPIRFDGR